MPQFLLLTLFLLPLFAEAQETPHEKYIAKYKNLAVREMKRTGVPASIKLAQGLLESQYGESRLAVNANNHFGIKCKSSWQGETFSLEDDDYEDGVLIKSCFRKYPNVLASYSDHSNFLRSRPWYASLFELNTRDYKSWAYGLKEAGYATDPEYPQKLISRIEQWRLDRFDNEKPLDPIREVPPPITIPLPAQTIASVNGLKYFIARQGQTPIGVSKRTKGDLKSIIEANEKITQPAQVLKEGERVFLEKKKKKYKGKRYHRATGTEDLYQISQLYGVRLKRLAKRNRMSEEGAPYLDEIIKLRGWRVKKSKAPAWRFKILQPPAPKDYTKDGIIYHTIVQGETLYKLSRKYRTTVGRLRILNSLQNDNLKIGQILKIK